MSRRARIKLPAGTAPAATRWAALAGLRRRAWRALVAMAVGIGLTVTAAGPATEYQVKAALLAKLVLFTEWPASAFANTAAPLVLGVVGEDPFGPTLDEVVKGDPGGRRPLVVRRFRPGEDISACHLLFISRSEKVRLKSCLAVLENKPVLTVGDFDRLCEQGGMINLALSADSTVKPQINPDAARAAGLRFSSKLLSLRMVRLVKTEP